MRVYFSFASAIFFWINGYLAQGKLQKFDSQAMKNTSETALIISILAAMMAYQTGFAGFWILSAWWLIVSAARAFRGIDS